MSPPLILVSLFLNLLFVIREFFAVTDYILNLRAKEQSPKFEDYCEFFFAGVLITITCYAFGYYFRQ